MLNDSSSSNTIDTAEVSPLQRGPRVAMVALVSTIVLFFAAQVAGGLVISLVPLINRWSHAQANDWLNNSVTAQFTYGLLADGLLLLGIVGMLKWFHWSWATIGLKRPQLRQLFIGAGAAVPYYILLLAAVLVAGALVPSLNIQQKQELGFDSISGGTALVLTFVSLVVLPPLVEEIAMRGFLYTGLRRWLPKVAAAVVVSALFGAAHLAEGGSAGPLWIGAIDTFTLSLVLVTLRELTGNLWAGITLHAVKNSIAFVPFLIQHLH
jgi:membrane protease YdiL (CAAX protease family)